MSASLFVRTFQVSKTPNGNKSARRTLTGRSIIGSRSRHDASDFEASPAVRDPPHLHKDNPAGTVRQVSAHESLYR